MSESTSRKSCLRKICAKVNKICTKTFDWSLRPSPSSHPEQRPNFRTSYAGPNMFESVAVQIFGMTVGN
jgi:hypothetical protein